MYVRIYSIAYSNHFLSSQQRGGGGAFGLDGNGVQISCTTDLGCTCLFIECE